MSSIQICDGFLMSSDYVMIPTTSTRPYGFLSIGDTNAIQNQRLINNSNDAGAAGEYCFGTDDQSITYLYYCVIGGDEGAAKWVRVAMDTWVQN